MAIPAAKSIRSGPPLGQQLYTIKFKNGQVLKHQDPFALSQFRSDGRLAAVLREATQGVSKRLPGEESSGP